MSQIGVGQEKSCFTQNLSMKWVILVQTPIYPPKSLARISYKKNLAFTLFHPFSSLIFLIFSISCVPITSHSQQRHKDSSDWLVLTVIFPVVNWGQLWGNLPRVFSRTSKGLSLSAETPACDTEMQTLILKDFFFFYWKKNSKSQDIF